MRLGRSGPLRALALMAMLATALAFARPATAEDLDTLKESAQRIADEVSGLEHRLEGLNVRRAALEDQILETNKSLAELQLEIDAADEAYREAYERFVERAIESYKGGGSSTHFALLLTARDIDDFFMLEQATSHQAELDASSLSEFTSTRDRATNLQEAMDSRKQRLLAATARVDTISGEIDTALDLRKQTLSELSAEIERIEEELRREAEEAAQTATGFPGAQLPTGKPDKELLEKLSGAGPSLTIPEEFIATGVTFEGLASWYGPGFEGNSTANGDTFDSRLYTAASKELPLGTWLHIKHEGKGVVVLVNDRGPYVEPRILDLSKAAAEALGMISKGVGWVEAEIIVKA